MGKIEKPSEISTQHIKPEVPPIEVIKTGDIPPGLTIDDSDIRTKIYKLLESAGRANGPVRLNWDKGVIYVTFPDFGETLILRGPASVGTTKDYIGSGKNIEFTPNARIRMEVYLKRRAIKVSINDLSTDIQSA